VAATQTGAEVVNASDRIGTLEAGKFADIVACDENPIVTIRALRGIRFVMQNGRVVRFEPRSE
jgi:imidazolonepropionase-like amidohydrolase